MDTSSYISGWQPTINTLRGSTPSARARVRAFDGVA
jgi:hypothetical protein